MRITNDYADAILPFDEEAAHIWGRLRVPHPQNPLDKQIAATALLYELVVVSRNIEHYEPTGVLLMNPFTSRAPGRIACQQQREDHWTTTENSSSNPA
jgi:predicted nucleic acid-binding protein